MSRTAADQTQIARLRAMRDAASITPERASYLAMAGELTEGQAREMGTIAAAYIMAGKRSMGAPGLLNPNVLLVHCFQVLTGQEVTF